MGVEREMVPSGSLEGVTGLMGAGLSAFCVPGVQGYILKLAGVFEGAM